MLLCLLTISGLVTALLLHRKCCNPIFAVCEDCCGEAATPAGNGLDEGPATRQPVDGTTHSSMSAMGTQKDCNHGKLLHKTRRNRRNSKRIFFGHTRGANVAQNRHVAAS